MLFNVPQNIDVEDKIVGPFTAKQLGWMGAILGIGGATWTLNDNKITAIFIILPVALFCAAAAFYRPYGQPFLGFLAHAANYMWKPKVYVWKRYAEKAKAVRVDATRKMAEKSNADPLAGIHDLASSLDSGGKERSDKLMEMLREREYPKRKV